MSSNNLVRFFNPGKAYLSRKDEYDAAIQRVLTNGDLILRKDLEDFERDLAAFTGSKYAVGLNSGTDALLLALQVVGVKKGDEVIVPSHTFVATAQVVQQLGATPVLVDIGEDWQQFITEKTTACIPAHIAGVVLDWEPVEGIAMIDDSCQSLGAKGFKGVIQCWSFYPAKILGAFGDAGGITTDNEAYARDIKDLGNHWKSDYSKWGINSRMDNLQAAVLNIKLKNLPKTLARRHRIAEMYTARLDERVGLPVEQDGRVWQDYIVKPGPLRDDLFTYLKDKGVETMKNEYPFPIPKGPNSLEYEAGSLRLPINEILNDVEVLYVIDTVNAYYANTV